MQMRRMAEDTLHVAANGPEHALGVWRAEQLTDRSAMEAFLDRYGAELKTKERAAAGAYFGGWLAFPAMAFHLLLSTDNVALDLGLANVEVALYSNDGRPAFRFRVNGWRESPGPAEPVERTAWRAEQLAGFYRHTMRPLVESAAEAARMPVGAVWGQLPTRYNYYLDLIRQRIGSEELRSRIDADYDYLRLGIGGEPFGRPDSPLNVRIRWLEDMREEGKRVRMKNACCHFHLTEGGYYCYTCPKMTEHERAERRRQAREAAAT